MSGALVAGLVAVLAAVVVLAAVSKSRRAGGSPAAETAAPPPGSDSPVHDSVRRGVRAFMRGRYEEAFELLEPAARQDNLKAQQLLAKMYFAGHGVAADSEQYLYWLKRAAANGDKPSKAKVKKIEAGTM